MQLDITKVTHPLYDDYYLDWVKWRLAYQGGRRFVDTYTQKFSARENDDDFNLRKSVTYCPRFAGSAIDEIKNSIFQRMVDITRVGGTPSYMAAVNGGQYGVDLLGSSMNSFIGRKILADLLTMKKVGVYVDMPVIEQLSLANINNVVRPYLYTYLAEDILSWTYDDTDNPNEFRAVLLRETHYEFDEITHLPIGTQHLYKHFWMESGVVYVQIYNSDSTPTLPEPLNLKISRIPFHVYEISHSLMAEVSDYQVALLNLASSDMGYALKSNYPFYVEQFDPASYSPYLQASYDEESNSNINNSINNNINSNPNTRYSDEINVRMGVSTGRRYPINLNPPAFIHPSSEPLLASMKKQEQLKQEIRLLVNLSVSNLEPGKTSAESKGFDERGLESGLSYIGLELEHGERQIAQIWAMYENSKQYATVKYPEKYNLKSDEERRADCSKLKELQGAVPSVTYQREISKQISNILLRNRVPDSILSKIDEEINTAKVINIDPNVISKSVEQGLVGLDTASQALGYPPNEVEKAKQDHADRLRRIVISQTEGAAAEIKNNNGNNNTNNTNTNNGMNNPGSRGLQDLSSDPKSDSKQEKAQSRDTTSDPVPTDKTRGNAK